LHPDFNRDVHCILGLPFDAVDEARAVRLIREAVHERRRCFLSTPNLNFAVASLDDPAFRASVLHSDLNTADGMPIVWIARLLGVPLRERVSGAGLFERLREDAAERIGVYFFGGPDGVAAAACDRLNAQGGGLHCVGSDSPGFGSIDDMSSSDCIARINASGADFVVVSLGAKKGQAWIERNRALISAPVVSHLGAVVNFVAGTVRRSPRVLQRLGLEWFWRIVEEPALWRRYAADGLALGRLLLVRVIPYAWCLRTRRPSAEQAAAARAERLDRSGSTVLRLEGAWSMHNLDRLRAAAAAAACEPGPLHVDLSAVTHLDSAAIAQLSLLQAACSGSARGWSTTAPSPRVCRLLRFACADYLLQENAAAAQPGREEVPC
jgi:N-acetylglucosaminyldiphosphoundecaprenol N-acetyl-beta-D-mannosaminyltransferase